LSTLTIGRVNVECTVSREHPQPHQVRSRLNEALLPDRLANLLRSTLQSALPPDDAVCFIRRISFDLALDVARHDDGQLASTLAAHVARQVAAQVTHLAREDPDGADAVLFPDRHAYVAHFIEDLLAGRAWDRWYHAEFDGLRSLLPSQAIREALVREPALTEGILLRLRARGRLEPALAAMSERDLARAYAACRSTAGGPAPPSRTVANRLLALWARTPLAPDEGWVSPGNHLRLWLAVRAQAAPGERPRPALHPTITHLLRAAALLHRPDTAARLLSLLAEGRLATAVAAVRGEGVEGALTWLQELSALADNDERWLRATVAVLAPALAPQPSPAASADFSVASPVAGLFLLLPNLVDLRIDRLLAAHAPGETVAAVWRYWLLLKCLGSPRFDAGRHDPGLLLAAGLPAAPDADQQAQAAAGPARMEALRRDFLGVLHDQGRVAGRHLVVEVVQSPAGARQVVVRDALRDYWLALAPVAAEGRNSDTKALASIEAACGHPPARIWHGREAVSTDDAPDFARRAKAAAPDLAYFHLPGLPAPLDAALTLLAQATLRTFSRRLIGFAWSSPDYLFGNFLAGRGTVRALREAIAVELPLPPLHTVLHLAGFHGHRYPLPWLDDRPVELHLGRE